MLQLDAGLRSHRRRFGSPRGFWLPECAYAPGLEHLLAEQGIEHFCVDQSAAEPDGAALRPIATDGPVAFPIDWPTVERVWSLAGYPSDPGYADFHRKSLRGTRPWAIDGSPYEPEAAAERAREQGADFAACVGRAAAPPPRQRTASAGLLVFAIDTELLGHWWWEGPGVARGGARRVAGRRGQAVDAEPRPGRARARAPAARRLLVGRGQGHAHLGLTGCRRPRLGVAQRSSSGSSARSRPGASAGPALVRAARELLAVQSSDWAFLDYRLQAGDYPFRRALDHSRALFESIDSGAGTVPAMRNLAPDLSSAPLLEP